MVSSQPPCGDNIEMVELLVWGSKKLLWGKENAQYYPKWVIKKIKRKKIGHSSYFSNIWSLLTKYLKKIKEWKMLFLKWK